MIGNQTKKKLKKRKIKSFISKKKKKTKERKRERKREFKEYESVADNWLREALTKLQLLHAIPQEMLLINEDTLAKIFGSNLDWKQKQKKSK